MGYPLFVSIVRVLFLVQLIYGVSGWGNEGHYAICKIAEAYLNEDTLAVVQELLPRFTGGHLAALCSWADEIKYNYRFRGTNTLHYVDTPDFMCNYNYSRDCHDTVGHKHKCVTGAIYKYAMELSSAYDFPNSGKKYKLLNALLFLAHFIGDVHQPLHVGFLGDGGGNTIIVRWYQEITSLHHVWDYWIIEHALRKFYDNNLFVMIESIKRNITEDWAGDMSSWDNCGYNQTVCPDMYASESISLACKFAYKNATPGSTLVDDYFLSRLPIVEERIAQAGVRLAAVLNRIFSYKTVTVI